MPPAKATRYPGAAPLLAALGCSRAAEIASRPLPLIASEGRDPATALVAALEGDEIDPALEPYEEELQDAADEWEFLTDADKDLARLLMRMELTTEQTRAVISSAESRAKHGLPAGADELVANPYLLSENFIPKKDGELVLKRATSVEVSQLARGCRPD